MATGLNQVARKGFLDYWSGGTFTAPTAWWISLHTADPGDTTTVGSEVGTGTGYGRVQVNAFGGGGVAWIAATTANPTVLAHAGGAITFTTSTGAWASSALITHFGICSASTAGNLLGRGLITVPSGGVIVGSAGITLSFANGALTMTMTTT